MGPIARSPGLLIGSIRRGESVDKARGEAKSSTPSARYGSRRARRADLPPNDQGNPPTLTAVRAVVPVVTWLTCGALEDAVGGAQEA